jgi:hypothetical protein
MTIPSSIVSDIVSSTSGLMVSIQPLLLILLGIGIAFYVVKRLIVLFPKG